MEVSFGVAFLWNFRENDVAVKRMKEILASEALLDEFVKEVEMLDTFLCDQIHDFNDACFIHSSVMTVTEFAP